MREESKVYHLDTLNTHSKSMFETLLYEQHITSGNLKIIDFYPNEPDIEKSRGFFLRKNKTLYWIDDKEYQTKDGIKNVLDLFPLRAKETEDVEYNDDVVHIITKPIPFNISPSQTFPNVRGFINEIFPFEHEEPKQWTLMKMIAIMGFVGKTMLVVSTPPAFGKTDLFAGLNCINNMSPVFKPRSVPGMLNQINSTGNIAFDEIQNCNAETRKIIEDIILYIGDGKPTYHNGALASHNTKQSYDIWLQSMTFLINRLEDYKNPEKTFFEYIFDNKNAVDNRLLKLRFDGVLKEKFDKNFDTFGLANDKKRHYIDIAKYLLFLQESKQRNSIETLYKPLQLPIMSARQENTYEELIWLISLYSQSQSEFNKYVEILNTAIIKYKDMVRVEENNKLIVEEERI